MKMKNQFNQQQLLLLIGLSVFGIAGRYMLFGMSIQPFPNFEVIMVVSFLAIMIIRSPLALLVPLVSMIGSDLLIGNPIFIGSQMNRIVLFTYSGFSLIALISLFTRDRLWNGFGQLRVKTFGFAAGLGVGFVLLYDLWTNLGWWYLMYPHDAASLAAVFTAGVPFMIYHMISGAVTFVAIGVPVLLYVARRKEHLQPFTLRMSHKIPAVVLVIGLVVLSFTGTAMTVPEKSEIWLEKSHQTSVTIEIVGDGWAMTDQLVAYQDETVFSLLQRSAERNGFSIQYTYYAQFDSTLITSIHNAIGGTDGKYWQFYVNGDIPMIGADKYPISNGDAIRWSFEVPPY